VLSLVITSYLYKKHGDFAEGKMAKVRAALVSRKALYRIAKEIKIDRKNLRELMKFLQVAVPILRKRNIMKNLRQLSLSIHFLDSFLMPI